MSFLFISIINIMSENQSDLKAFFNPIPDYTGKIVLRNVVHKTSLICCVLDCRERVNETTTLHSFPRNHALRRLWKTTAKINKPIRLWHRICNQHFTPADYVGSKNVTQYLHSSNLKCLFL